MTNAPTEPEKASKIARGYAAFAEQLAELGMEDEANRALRESQRWARNEPAASETAENQVLDVLRRIEVVLIRMDERLARIEARLPKGEP